MKAGPVVHPESLKRQQEEQAKREKEAAEKRQQEAEATSQRQAEEMRELAEAAKRRQEELREERARLRAVYDALERERQIELDRWMKFYRGAGYPEDLVVKKAFEAAPHPPIIHEDGVYYNGRIHRYYP